jgi:hypothetical protein
VLEWLVSLLCGSLNRHEPRPLSLAGNILATFFKRIGPPRFLEEPKEPVFLEWAQQDLNLRPSDYESAALTN